MDSQRVFFPGKPAQFKFSASVFNVKDDEADILGTGTNFALKVRRSDSEQEISEMLTPVLATFVTASERVIHLVTKIWTFFRSCMRSAVGCSLRLTPSI